MFQLQTTYELQTACHRAAAGFITFAERHAAFVNTRQFQEGMAEASAVHQRIGTHYVMSVLIFMHPSRLRYEQLCNKNVLTDVTLTVPR